jgi:hypothetical protein
VAGAEAAFGRALKKKFQKVIFFLDSATLPGVCSAILQK